MNNILKDLKVVANQLENGKMYDEANIIDKVIYKVAARDKIDMDARVQSRNETVTKQMIYSYNADIQHVESMMSDKENPENIKALQSIADRTEIALDKPDDYEGVLSLLNSALQKYEEHLSELKKSSGESEEGFIPGSSEVEQKQSISGGANKLLENIGGLVEETANKHGIPVPLFKALVNQESGGRAGVVSSAGAVGLTQLKPETAKSVGVTNIYDPAQNLDGGAKYLMQQYNRFKSWALALAAYNAGPEAVAKYNGIPPYKETINYVRSILNKAGMNA